jgi:hypothetical protein
MCPTPFRGVLRATLGGGNQADPIAQGHSGPHNQWRNQSGAADHPIRKSGELQEMTVVSSLYLFQAPAPSAQMPK